MYHSRDAASVFEIQLDASEISEGDDATGVPIIFPDKDVLFTSEFKRSGSDLLLVSQNNNAAIIYNYFKGDRRASIATLEGADLSGATVEALAGPDNPGEYAQTTAVAANQPPIGRVEKVSGSATVLRNGMRVELHLGDPVAKGDVVQTSSDSSLTIKFGDGTVFNLSSSARIVLNEMVYAADLHENFALFTLVQGVIGFVAGKIAKTGDLKVETPVATMAIRGTAVQAEISAASGTTKFSLLTEPDGRVGSFALLDKHNQSRVIATLSDARTATIVAPISLSDVRVTQISKTQDDIRFENDLVRDMFQTFSQEQRQRRGSSDFDGSLVVPTSSSPSFDDFDQGPFTPFLAKPALLQPILFIPREPSPVEIRAKSAEDGPVVQFNAITGSSNQTLAAVQSLVNLPVSLPPGVTFLGTTRTFSLDPSHPAYQSLGAGETATVTVNYSLSRAGIQIPASVSWTVAGRNDAPIARDDHFAGIGELGQKVLATNANDSDIDHNALHITRWTQPIEGSLSLSSSGKLIFDPGSDFQALTDGQTATVSFAYTISDGKGGTDTATAAVQVRGSGSFSSPQITAETSGALAFNHQRVSFTIGAPSEITSTTADLHISVALGPVLQPQMNILYVLDISGSTSGSFAGTAVGDLNQDGHPNTVLDAEIGSLIGLTERIRQLGFSAADVSVTVIPFNGNADPADQTNTAQNMSNTDAVTFSLGGTGDETIANFLKSLDAGGGTDFEHALQATIEKLQALDQGGEKNLVYFLSDGNGTGSFADELAILNTDHHAQITAVGIGENAALALLDTIDNTGGAELVSSADQLDAALFGSPLPSGKIVDLDLFVNGQEIPEIGPEDLVITPDGLALNVSVAGLARHVGDNNTLMASITFASGETFTTELKVKGALPLSTDLII